MQRKLYALIAIILVICVLAGCTSTGAPSAAAPSGSAAAPAPSSSEAWVPGAPIPVSDTPIELRVFRVDKADRINDNEIQKLMEARSNVKFVWEIAPENNGPEVFNLTLASGDMPDIMIYNYDELMKYALQGAFVPLDDMMPENAPNMVNILEEFPIVKKNITNSDGKIYTFPMIAAISAQNTFLVRRDWLDQLDLPMPETREDWLTVLRGFRDNDMNGNGDPSDEVPFTVRTSPDININLNFYESFGIDNKFFLEDGKVLYGPSDPRFKSYLEFMNLMYTENLLDVEYITNDTAAWEMKMSSGVAGASYDFNHRGYQINVKVKPTQPEFHMSPVLPPMTDNGQVETRHQMEIVRSTGAAISATSEYAEEITRYYDYVYSDEGRVTMIFGIEGETFTYDANGEPQYTEDYLDPAKRGDLQNQYGINADWPMVQHPTYEAISVDQEVTDMRNQLHEIMLPPYPKTRFTDEEQTVINEKFTEIETYVFEMWDKYIMGTESLDSFDQYVETLYSMGLQDVIDVHQAACDRYNAG